MAKKETAAPAKDAPSHGVYVIEGEAAEAFRTKIGAVWPHQDGQGFTLTLTAIPLTGHLLLCVRKETGE